MVNMGEPICVIRLKRKTRERLKGHGKKGESYDDVINRLLNGVEKREGKKPK